MPLPKKLLKKHLKKNLPPQKKQIKLLWLNRLRFPKKPNLKTHNTSFGSYLLKPYTVYHF